MSSVYAPALQRCGREEEEEVHGLVPATTPNKSMVRWNECAESPGRRRFCEGLKFGKGSADRNQQSLDMVTADDYAAMSGKNHAETWMHDTDRAIDHAHESERQPAPVRPMKANGNPLPFGLLVLVLDYAEVAAAHAEKELVQDFGAGLALAARQ
jgi:hypothetical protein